jgi:Ca2+-binding EF-hand superfamily protein
MHLEIEALKNKLIHTHDFNWKMAFKAIDDWSYGFIDKNNLKRFLINMGYRHPQAHKKNWRKALDMFLHAVIRRFDLNGDGKVDIEEFK